MGAKMIDSGQPDQRDVVSRKRYERPTLAKRGSLSEIAAIPTGVDVVAKVLPDILI